ncbi:MAG: two-component regulator propeller domain-containing protein [Pirellulaceae bacterium]
MLTKTFLILACFSTYWLYAPLPFCQLYGQQEKIDSPLLAQKVIQPKLIKTQGSDESDNIHAMLQDKKGDVWFATTGEGVYRYNGKGFVQYTQQDGLSSNTVYSMIEDSNGTIWFGTDKGASRYDGKSIAPVPFEFDNLGKNFRGGPAFGNSPEDINEVWSIMQLKSGSLWFGTTNGLYCYDGSRFSRLLDDVMLINTENLKLKKIQCMLQDRSGTIWLGSGLGEVEGLCRFDGKSITTVNPKIDGWIRKIIEDKNGAIWLSTRSKGIWRDNGDGFVKITIQDDRVSELLLCNQSLMQDRKGNIWFSGSETVGTVQTNSGIWRYNGEKFENFTAKDGLSDYGVWSMLEDDAGHIWVGTRNTGLSRSDGTRFVPFSE